MKFSFFIVILVAFLFGTSPAHAQLHIQSASFRVNGVCIQCKQRIQKSLRIKGVKSASWDIDTKMLTVDYNPDVLTLNKLHETVAAAGHDTELKKADDEVYKELPECCHYREMSDESEMDMGDTTRQEHLMGIVVEVRDGINHPLAGASIYWLGSSKGIVSNTHGEFILHRNSTEDSIVISYSGFKSDTVSVVGLHDIQVTLNRHEQLSGIVVTARKRTTYIDGYSPFRTAIITRKELLKAACCNLSESFETNPSVDVSYNDAVTGSKQIQLLGLAGIYTQLTVENLPGPRGIATPLGLNSIAGPWVESIQMIKGTGSVVNGFESIAGQINVELKKPRESDKLYFNGYVNTMGKTDINVNWMEKINSKWSTGLLLHDDFLASKQDFNNDGFRDLPTGNQFSGIHRWDYLGDNGLMSQLGVKVLLDNRTGGELDFDPTQKLTTGNYGLGMNTKRYEAFAKIGYVFPEKMHKSIGLQVSAFDHDIDSYFGLRVYQGHQKNFYSNLIYQTRLGNEKHQLKAGMSFLYDQYNEHLNDTVFSRGETIPGLFSEYTFSPSEKLDVVAGIRADHNSLYGWFATPRLNVRYQPFNNTTIRFIAGRGQRTANIFAENSSILVSSRQISILNSLPGKAYGLHPEVAWNKGISIDQKISLFKRNAGLSMDFYRNDFRQQVVMDLETARSVKFYNLDGRSFSNSLQAEFYFTPVNKLDVRMAWRYFDVKTSYAGVLKQKPFTAQHRAFANLAYDLKSWKFDYTLNMVGKKRIPSLSSNPPSFQSKAYSPSYLTMNAQVSKTLGKKKTFDIYVGGENLTNFFQKNAIIASGEPFGPYFDASMVWGPVSGRQIYFGFRYAVK